jgi:hypothetical protein
LQQKPIWSNNSPLTSPQFKESIQSTRKEMEVNAEDELLEILRLPKPDSSVIYPSTANLTKIDAKGPAEATNSSRSGFIQVEITKRENSNNTRMQLRIKTPQKP